MSEENKNNELQIIDDEEENDVIIGLEENEDEDVNLLY
jgi:hypothetical protein